MQASTLPLITTARAYPSPVVDRQIIVLPYLKAFVSHTVNDSASYHCYAKQLSADPGAPHFSSTYLPLQARLVLMRSLHCFNHRLAEVDVDDISATKRNPRAVRHDLEKLHKAVTFRGRAAERRIILSESQCRGRAQPHTTKKFFPHRSQDLARTSLYMTLRP